MSLAEHTPRNQTMRDAPAEQPVSQIPQEPTAAPQETPHENNCTPKQTTNTIRVREIHMYTIPSREYSGHYSGSQLFHDVAKNPALYMDHADF